MLTRQTCVSLRLWRRTTPPPPPHPHLGDVGLRIFALLALFRRPLAVLDVLVPARTRLVACYDYVPAVDRAVKPLQR